MIVLTRSVEDDKALQGLDIDPRSLEDDGTDYKDKTVAKPWGFERQIHRDLSCSLWRLSIRSRAETSMHCHPSKTTMLTVERGEVIVSTLRDRHSLMEGSSVLILPGVFHRTFALNPATVMELEFPGNKRDLVRLEDKYGRSGMPYETCGLLTG